MNVIFCQPIKSSMRCRFQICIGNQIERAMQCVPLLTVQRPSLVAEQYIDYSALLRLATAKLGTYTNCFHYPTRHIVKLRLMRLCASRKRCGAMSLDHCVFETSDKSVCMHCGHQMACRKVDCCSAVLLKKGLDRPSLNASRQVWPAVSGKIIP